MTYAELKGNNQDRFWAYVTAFGALWGFVEVTVGSFLMSLRLPFIGILLAVTGATILVAQRQILSVRGASLATGVVAALCKSVSPGGIILQPMIGIMAEAALVEIVFLVMPWGVLAAPFAGMAAAFWTVFQQIAYQYVIYGAKLIELYIVILRRTSKAVGMTEDSGWWAIAAFLAAVMVFGSTGGWVGWRLGRDARKMMDSKRGYPKEGKP